MFSQSFSASKIPMLLWPLPSPSGLPRVRVELRPNLPGNSVCICRTILADASEVATKAISSSSSQIRQVLVEVVEQSGQFWSTQVRNNKCCLMTALCCQAAPCVARYLIPALPFVSPLSCSVPDPCIAKSQSPRLPTANLLCGQVAFHPYPTGHLRDV